MHETLDFILNTSSDERENPFPRITCKDGATLSVQASSGHYCSPRTNHATWSSVEVGSPSVTPPASWKEYAEKWRVPFSRLLMIIFHGWPSLMKYWNFKQKFQYYLREIRRVAHMVFSPDGTQTVYGYIPIDLVREFIDLHGGEA